MNHHLFELIDELQSNIFLIEDELSYLDWNDTPQALDRKKVLESATSTIRNAILELTEATESCFQHKDVL
jgi:hypothetical protein